MVGPAAAMTDGAPSGFGGHLPFGKRPAVLLVDLVIAYCDPGSPLALGPVADHAIAAANRLADAARKTRLPVIFTQVVYQPGGADGGQFYRKVPALRLFEAGSPLARFPDALTRQPDEPVVTKQYASAFFGTSLAAMLTTMAIDTLLIGGFSTSGCVRATAVDAIQNGFVPYVVRDACADRGAQPHEANLSDLQTKYAEVVGLDRALELMAQVRP